LTYIWYVDGKHVTDLEPTFEYKTTYASAGKHEVKVSVQDPAGASAVISWNVTVNNINAAPEITDSTPPGDAVSMNENSARKFRVTDVALDGDKHNISWYLDGNGTGVSGESYQYSADFDSAGRHEIAAQVSDGELSVGRTWHINVANVNRPPVAVISAPATGAEFMAGDDIALDGGQSSDIDGDTLSMSWTEGLKTLGSGATLTIKLSRGEHTIVLNVNDGQKNGTDTAQVQIMARYLDFSGDLRVDKETPVEGRMLKLTAELINNGDGSINELSVSFRVDGTEVSTKTIGGIGPDSIFPLEFHWKAVKGDHKLEVRVNNQTFSKTVTVAQEHAVTAPFGGGMTLWIAVAVVAVVAIVAAVAVFGPGRKKAHVQPGGSGLFGAEGRSPVSTIRGKGRTGAGPKSARDGRRGEGRGSPR
jgi:chitodextrinase